jgi:hypothetical protein
VGRVREIRRLRRRLRVGAPDPSLTAVSGMAAVTELVDRLGMIRLLDSVIGPIKARGRGFTRPTKTVGDQLFESPVVLRRRQVRISASVVASRWSA